MLNNHKLNKNENSVLDDNKGFSLIELLVSVLIISLVFIPLYNSFVSSSRTNAKSQKVMLATSVAENVMEKYKTMSSEAIKGELSVSASDAVAFGSNFKCCYEDYEYAGNKYDLFFDIDTAKYDDISDPGNLGVNKKDLVDIPGVDAGESGKDILYSRSYNEDYNYYKKFEEASATIAAGKTADEFAEIVTREFIINIEAKNVDGTTGTPDITSMQQYVSLKVRYTVPAAYSSWVPAGGDILEQSIDLRVYDDATHRELRNIYILYVPNYKSTSASVKDAFTVNIDADTTMNWVQPNIYLVKQENGMTYPELISKEMTYAKTITLRECFSTNLATYNASKNNEAKTKIYTNFDINLGKLASLSDSEDITDAVMTNAFAANNLMKYRFNPSTIGTVDANGIFEIASPFTCASTEFLPDDTKIDINSLSSSSEKERLYDITLTVYPAGAYDGREDVDPLNGVYNFKFTDKAIMTMHN